MTPLVSPILSLDHFIGNYIKNRTYLLNTIHHINLILLKSLSISYPPRTLIQITNYPYSFKSLLTYLPLK